MLRTLKPRVVTRYSLGLPRCGHEAGPAAVSSGGGSVCPRRPLGGGPSGPRPGSGAEHATYAWRGGEGVIKLPKLCTWRLRARGLTSQGACPALMATSGPEGTGQSPGHASQEERACYPLGPTAELTRDHPAFPCPLSGLRPSPLFPPCPGRECGLRQGTRLGRGCCWCSCDGSGPCGARPWWGSAAVGAARGWETLVWM